MEKHIICKKRDDLESEKNYKKIPTSSHIEKQKDTEFKKQNHTAIEKKKYRNKKVLLKIKSMTTDIK